jgi:tripartite-type tricarboxylate transporter receptor subunit TctC
MRSRLLREGTVPIASTPEGFSEIIRQDFDMWNEIIKASNIQLE